MGLSCGANREYTLVAKCGVAFEYCYKKDSMANSNMNNRNLYIGVVLIVMGVVWLLKNFGVIDLSVFRVIFYWQMAIVAIGGYLLVLRRWILGAVLVFAGLLLLTQNIFHIDIQFTKVVIPAIIIASGAAIAFQKR